MKADQQLLRDYTETGSETAFNDLVARHLDLVYATAIRVLAGDTHLAEDAVQTVFTDLSRKANSLRHVAVLAGWLHRHTFFVASSIVRTEQRRRHREQEAVQMYASDEPASPDWERLRPVLDEALQGLGTDDRNAIVLRFLQGRDLRAVGAALGSNEDAAQKRVSRALERLRGFLAGRGVTLTASALAAAIGTNAIAAAPVGMAATVATAALAGTGAGTGVALTSLKLMAWIKSQGTALAALAIALTVANTTYLAQQESERRSDLQRIEALTPSRTVSPSPASAAVLDPPGFGFHWSQLESSDYRQYIANLRAVGCPESAIRDLIAAELNQAYAPRFRAIWRPSPRPFWSRSSGDRPTADHLRQFLALDQEKAKIMQELLGRSVRPQELIDLAFMQTDRSESELLFLPEDKREAALAALTEGGYEEKKELHQLRDPNSDPEYELFEEKLAMLGKVLSPDELLEYRLRNSPRANWLRQEIQYLDCTKEEFRALLDQRERDLGPSRDRLGVEPAAAVVEVRKVLGDERAQEFARVSDYGYLNARRAADRCGLPADLADQAGQITYEARTAVERTAKDGTLSAPERQRRIESLESQAETRLRLALGEQCQLGIRKAMQRTLQNTAQLSPP